MNSLTLCSPQGALSGPSEPPATRLLRAFTAGRTACTLAAYRADLEAFARFVGVPDVAAAAGWLLNLEHGGANEAVTLYRGQLVEHGYAPATINRRLAAVRSLVGLARQLGLVAWALDVKGERPGNRRMTAGPGQAGFRQMLGASQGDAPGAVRDRAIMRLLYDLGLRRSEVVGLDVAHVDLNAGTVAVLGKGRSEREALTLPPETSAALRGWLAVRGAEPGPLFLNVDRSGLHPGRLTANGLYRRVRWLGARVGLVVRPHGLRHAAITSALDVTGGDVRKVQRFARHADPRTTVRYDDDRSDLAGQVARAVAAGAGS